MNKFLYFVIFEKITEKKKFSFYQVHNSCTSRVCKLQLEGRQVTPPYNPSVSSDRDLQHFDTTFTDEAPNLTPDDR